MKTAWWHRLLRSRSVLPGLPNYGIAPGSLFIVVGTNLNSQPLSAPV